jgi:hypothetical protein
MRIYFFVQKEELTDNLALHVRVEQREEICQYKTSVFFLHDFSGKGKQPNSAAQGIP